MGALLPRFLSSCIPKLPETLLSPQDKVKIDDSESRIVSHTCKETRNTS